MQAHSLRRDCTDSLPLTAERVHEVLTRVIVGLAGTALAALGLYAAYETISAAEPMGILLVAMAFGMSAYCARLPSVDIRSSNPRTP
jgi:hypothetical protein